METRKDKINAHLTKYIQLKKDFFEVYCGELYELFEFYKINAQKRQTVNDLFEYFIDKEYINISKKFNEIVFPNPGCEQSIRACKREEYDKCLVGQQKEISDMFNDNYVDTHIVIDVPEGIESCHVDYYYDGHCQGVDIVKIPSYYD
jgi:hypothetical protein